MHGLYNFFYNMRSNSNKKSNKTKDFLLMKGVAKKNGNKTFINIFDITSKCHKL
jgi:hypothetical protein